MSDKTPTPVTATMARQNFGELLSRVNIGQEEFIIKRDRKQLAMLVPIKSWTSAPPQEKAQQQEADIKEPELSISDMVNGLDFRNSAGICKALFGSVHGEKDESSVEKQAIELKFSFKRGDSIFIDSDPIIYYWSRNDIYFRLMEEIFNKVYDNKVQCFFSAITLINSILYQDDKKETSLVRKCSNYLNCSLNFNYHQVNYLEAAVITKVKTSHNNLSIDQAMQLGTAMAIGADYFLTNNQAYNSLPDKILGHATKIIVLDNLIQGPIPEPLVS